MKSEPGPAAVARGRGVSWELVGYAALFVLLALSARMFQPVVPADVEHLREAASVDAMASLLLALDTPVRRALARLAWPVVAALALVSLVLIGRPLFDAAAIAGLVWVLVLTVEGAIAVWGAVLAGLGTLALLAGRHKLSWRTFRLSCAGMAAVYLAGYLGTAAKWWWPATADECASLERPGSVERLSPAAWLAEDAQPYEVQYLPEEHLLVATFKMAGDAVFPWWDDPRANKLWMARIDGTDHPVQAHVDFDRGLLTQYVRYNPSRHAVAVGAIGYGKQSIAIVDLADFPHLDVQRVVRMPFAIADAAVSLDGGSLFVPRSWGVFDRYDWDTLARAPAPFARLQLDPDSLLNGEQLPGSRYAYYSSIGGPFSLDLLTGKVRTSSARFAFGNILAMPSRHVLWATDLLRRRLLELSTPGLNIRRTTPLGYLSRALATDDRQRLFVGNWLTGALQLFDATTLKREGRTVQVGRNLRQIAYDSQDDLLFAGSACGVYQVHPSAWSSRKSRVP